MNIKFQSRLWLLMVTGLFFVSCSEDDLQANLLLRDQIETSLITGTWEISSFINDGDDQTSEFEAYSFVFSDNGTISVSGGESIFNGTWSVLIDDDSDDDSDDDDSDDDDSDDDDSDDDDSDDDDSDDDEFDDLELLIQFEGTTIFIDLNDDFDIESYSDNLIEIYEDIDDSEGEIRIILRRT